MFAIHTMKNNVSFQSFESKIKRNPWSHLAECACNKRSTPHPFMSSTLFATFHILES